MRSIAVALLFLFALQPAWSAVKGQEVEYKAGDVALKGYLAADDAAKGKRPAVLVVHEWWGHDEHARNSARKLAEAGYVALALDMFGEGKQAHHPADAGKFAGEVRQNLPLMRARFDAAREFLARQPNVDPSRLAAIGYCFGGSVVLQMAREGEDLRGVVSLHGALGSDRPAQAGRVKAKVLALNGADDPMVPKQDVEAFQAEMKAAGVDFKVVNYPGAKHAFTNPAATARGKEFNLPLEYHADADRKSWQETLTFLERVMQ